MLHSIRVRSELPSAGIIENIFSNLAYCFTNARNEAEMRISLKCIVRCTSMLLDTIKRLRGVTSSIIYTITTVSTLRPTASHQHNRFDIPSNYAPLLN